MKLQVNKEVFDIDAESDVYNDYVSCIKTDEMDLSEHFSKESVKTLQNIDKMSGQIINEETYVLIDFLNLNYLLFNHSIEDNPLVNNGRIKEYYEIMKPPKDKNFLKNLLGNLGQHTTKLLNYKLLQKFIEVCTEASKIGNLECLRYAHENGCWWDIWTCAYAAENGYLECLKYAHENGCSWDNWTCILAARDGHLNCLKYAHENGCTWDKSTCVSAAEHGQLECLIYAHEHGCPWNKWTCVYAAKNGHLECLKYAHENGCRWDKWTCNYAAGNEHLECLKYACENKCPGNKEYIHLLIEHE
jgi:hypothetical protein